MGYIKESCKDKILETTHIEEVIGDFLTLKRSGANFKGFSPFTEEKTPSFMVSPAKQMFKCFSSGKGGNAISFLMEKGMSYPEALEYLAKKYNIQIEYEASEFSEKKVKQLEDKEKLRNVLKLVHDLYVQQYHNSAPEHPCRKEVEGKREYSKEKIIDWGIGFAPDNFIYDSLVNSGYQKEGEALGLIHLSERGNKFDKYSNRVIYPIHDRNGLLIGLAGRDIAENSKMGKWINPPVNSENILYNKSRVWYGLHKAKMEMRRKSEVYIVEGYNDVIAFQSYGVENTVAPCGTAITDDQINEIKKYCEKVIFCMDPDKAGVAAVLKHIPKFIKQGFRVDVLTLDLDPDDFVRKYNDVIALSGLDAMLNVPGVRVDGFQLLINEFIRKDYHQLEIDLKRESERLTHLEGEFKIEKQNIVAEVTETEGNLLEAKSFLKEVELAQGKKSEEYTEQSKTCATLKANLDTKKHKLKNITEPAELKQQKNIVSNTKIAYEEAFKNSELARSIGAKHLASLIIDVKDDAFFEIYFNWIATEAKILKSTLNSWIKEFRSESELVIDEDVEDLDYELPKEVKIPFKDLESDIKNFGLFMANNKIYFSLSKSEYRVVFVPLSNFDIEILQHMADEKYASLLIRMQNVMKNETIFDCPTETFNSLIRFKDVLSKHHNFIFKGKNDHLEKLHIFLSSKMGKGVKLDVPGFQLEGKFWVFNNLVITYEGELKTIDENGRYIQDNIHYYIPSANKIFKNNPYKFMQDKNFKYIKNEIPFFEFMSQAAKVHREHYISPILYGITSLFRDFVISKLNSFPILFLYGQGGTGKDELGRMVMSLTGVPQMPISLEAEISTQKATMRMLAKFRNGIMMFSEYKRGNQKQDGALKGIYDNIGYSIGTIESKFSTDYIPVEAGLILTGNEFPDSEPLLQRLIWTQMDKNVFTQKEKEHMELHKQHLSNGMSEYAVEFLRHRRLVEEKFLDKYNEWSAILTKIFPDVKVRIVNNLSVIAAIYDIFSNIVQFPFTKFEMIDNFKIGVEQQMKRINSTSVLAKFWECFISCFRGNVNDRIQAHKIVNIEASSLYIQWTHVFTKIQIQWFLLHKEAAPRKDVILEEIKKIPGCYVAYHDVYSFEKGRGKVRSSAIELNMLSLDGTIRNDILGAFMEQIYTESLFGDKEINNIDNLYVDKARDSLENNAIPIELPDNLK
jgi:DNA primase catalytic core